MNVQDLMIGDWVVDAGENARVASLTCDGIIETTRRISNIEVIKPIPLTSEILEKNGFQYFHKNYASLSYDHPFRLLMIRWPDENGTGALWTLCDIINIEFVHELQHVLRLCGIEKDIVL